jgi:signal transduction histidine kinase
MLLLICTAFVFISNIILGIFVYINNPKMLPNRAFALMCFGLSSWTAFNYLADYQLSNTLLWTRLSFFAITFLSAFLVIFLNNFTSRVISSKIFEPIVLMSALFVAIVSLTSYFIPSVDIVNRVSNVNTGPLYSIFLVYFIISFVFSIVIIILSWKKSSRNDRSRLGFLIFGILAMTVLASITNLFLPLVLGTNNFAIYGTLFSLIFVGSTSYAIIRHSLFDIRAVVVRSFAYVFTIITIAVVYGFLAFGVVGRYLFSTSYQQISMSQQIFNTALAVALAFTFQPIRRFFERISNKLFYRDRYDAQVVVNDIGRIVASEIRISQLCKKVSAGIERELNLSNVEIIVLDEKKIIYHSQKNVITEEIIKNLGNKILVVDEGLPENKLALMKNLNASLSIPLKTANNFIGYLVIGEKESGQVFNDEDIRTLRTIANELSVALENAKAFLEIKKFNVTLQERVDRATKNLQNANSQLKELDQAKDEFISMASHQLRTPLTTVKGYVSMLNDGDFGKLSNDQKKSIELALDGSNRMARLIDDLLNVSRMEAGKFYIDPIKVNLSQLINQEIEQLASLAKNNNVSLTGKISVDVPMMMLDENKTRQAIMNLIDNAIHYSEPPKGGGKVQVLLSVKDEEIYFSVVDNGIGVPKDQQSKLFTKMFRAKNAKEVRPDGTGLGLYLVKRVVEDQGGKIVFESKPGKGSVFGFKIPIKNNIKIDQTAKLKLQKSSKGKINEN